MQIVRTIAWVVVLFTLMAFSFLNWEPIEVRIWSNLVLETKLPVLVVVSFLLGLVPMWLFHRGSKWRMRRRISALETVTSKLATPTPPTTPAPAPVDETAVTPINPDPAREQ